MALGATNVDVNMKNINKRKTKSDIDDVLNSIFLLFLVFIAINFQFSTFNFQLSTFNFQFELCRLVQNVHEFNTFAFEQIDDFIYLGNDDVVENVC